MEQSRSTPVLLPVGLFCSSSLLFLEYHYTTSLLGFQTQGAVSCNIQILLGLSGPFTSSFPAFPPVTFLRSEHCSSLDAASPGYASEAWGGWKGVGPGIHVVYKFPHCSETQWGKAPLHEPASDASACYCPSSSIVPTWWDPAPTADGRPTLNMHMSQSNPFWLRLTLSPPVRESSFFPFQHPQDS